MDENEANAYQHEAAQILSSFDSNLAGDYYF
jgi:hypothetical protein